MNRSETTFNEAAARRPFPLTGTTPASSSARWAEDRVQLGVLWASQFSPHTQPRWNQRLRVNHENGLARVGHLASAIRGFRRNWSRMVFLPTM